MIAGGAARLFAALQQGLPTAPHRFGLLMELGVVPMLLLWLARIERLRAAASPAGNQD
ncbi:MAG TPA: hypothetical protein VFW35_10915 [Sphingomicrobium sp.]|nr:hypothetical protein [Sphingomicrobium sp.]